MDIFKRDGKFNKLWKGIAVENKVQATARDLVFAQIVWLMKRVDSRVRLVMRTHDEAVLCVPDDVLEETKRLAQEAFRWEPDWAKGINVKGEADTSKEYSKWSDLTEIEEAKKGLGEEKLKLILEIKE